MQIRPGCVTGTVPLTEDERTSERQRRQQGRTSDWLMDDDGLGADVFLEDEADAASEPSGQVSSAAALGVDDLAERT